MKTLRVTLGTGATQIVAGGNAQGTVAPFVIMQIQNNAANNIYVGDSTVSVSGTKGILLIPTQSFQISNVPAGNASDATQWYIAGTNGQVIDVNLN